MKMRWENVPEEIFERYGLRPLEHPFVNNERCLIDSYSITSSSIPSIAENQGLRG